MTINILLNIPISNVQNHQVTIPDDVPVHALIEAIVRQLPDRYHNSEWDLFLEKDGKFCRLDQEATLRSRSVADGDTLSLVKEKTFGEDSKPVPFRGRNASPARPLPRSQETGANVILRPCDQCGRDAGPRGVLIDNVLYCHKCHQENTAGAGDAESVRSSRNAGIAKHDIKKPRQFTNDLGMTFVWIDPGTFKMGSPVGEPERRNDEILHQVTLTRGFYMQTTQVTQGQWQAIMKNNPSDFKNGNNCPVEMVSWEESQIFIQRMNDLGDFIIYSLPTEAQWEYAARAGTSTPFCFGNSLSTDQANCSRNYPLPPCNARSLPGPDIVGVTRQKTLPVGSFLPNAWGLFDMHGNVREWCQDWYGPYPSGPVTDPTGPSSGTNRVYRGGGWIDDARHCRSASRNIYSRAYRESCLGLRLAGN